MSVDHTSVTCFKLMEMRDSFMQQWKINKQANVDQRANWLCMQIWQIIKHVVDLTYNT